MTLLEVLPPLVASACPRSCKSVLVLGGSQQLRDALEGLGLPTRRERVARACVGAVVAVWEHAADGSRLREARLALGQRGRVFGLCREQQLPELLSRLAGCGLHPKRLLIPRAGDAHGWVIAVASAGRPGGLVVQHWGSTKA